MSDGDGQERRRNPDVMSYRMGAVEQLAATNEKNLMEMDRLIREFIAAMPANYISRREYETHRLGETQHRETIRLQWPVWLLMFTNTLIAAGALAAVLSQ